MKFPFFWKKDSKIDKNIDELSHFLLHASDKEKHRVFIEAAKRANEDQRDLVERSRKLQNA